MCEGEGEEEGGGNPSIIRKMELAATSGQLERCSGFYSVKSTEAEPSARHKATLVAQDFSKILGVDYTRI